MILEIKNAGFKYESSGDPVFKNINLSVDSGEIFCILGPNGVGKTSLLKCISGLSGLSQGKVLLKGIDIKKMKRFQTARTISYVPQIHYPVFAYSVFDTVLMGRTPYLNFFSFPDTRDEVIVKNALESLGISHLSDKPYTKISGGERQLVIFARALAQEPEIIVLDEPTSHLDYGNQVRILSLIHHLSRKGTSVIMTSHNPDHAFMISDKVGIMFDKSISHVNSPQKIITEKILSQIYGIKVRLRHDDDFGKICVPKLNKKKNP
ncbi:MAG: ABC transporter ATP-binding protein [Deltaproteobacteria bacterium]|nr:ABC transporter ATP-binding protein [Deltaproteobacteria bacterium]